MTKASVWKRRALVPLVGTALTTLWISLASAQETQPAGNAAAGQPAPAAQPSTPATQPPAGTEPATPAAPTGGPVFSCAEMDHNFGEFWAGGKLEHSFQITNKGTEVLKIENVKPGCGCTLAGEYTKEIAPGGTGVIPTNLNTANMKSTFSKVVTVTTNDPNNKSVTLKLSGTAKVYVQVEPQNAMFGKIKYDDELTRTVKITNNYSEPLTLELVKDETWVPFTAELKEIAPGKEFELEIKGRKPFKENLNRHTFKLKTNIAAQPEVTVIAMATLPPKLELNKSVILIPKAQDSMNTHTVLVTNNGEQAVKITGATVADDPKVTTTVTERSEGKIHQVEVSFPPNYLPPEAGTKLVINTDDVEKPTLEVPIKRSNTPTPANAQGGKKKPIEELIGQKAPSAELTSLTGKKINTSDTGGKVTILDFVTSWCPHCKKQVPKLNELYEAYKDNPNVQFAILSQDTKKTEATPEKDKRAKTQEEVVSIFEGVGNKIELFIDWDKVAGKPFKANSFPTLVVVGKDGTVEAVHSGNSPTLKEDLKAQLDLLLAGKNRNDFPGAQKAAAAPVAPAPAEGGGSMTASGGNPAMVGSNPNAGSGQKNGEKTGG